MSNINLNFINQSNDANNSQVVIFQQGVSDDFQGSLVKNLSRLMEVQTLSNTDSDNSITLPATLTSIWVAAVNPEAEEPQITSVETSNSLTQLSIRGIASADLVMTGGGTGAPADAFKFTLENVVYA